MNDDRKQIEIQAADLLDKARLRVVSRHNLQFWSDILKRQFIADWSLPTAATNGDVVRYNPSFIVSLELSGCLFLIAHEVAHIKLGHHLRRGKKHPLLWNMACDYLINDMLKNEARHNSGNGNNLKLIDGCLWDSRYRFTKMTEEALYKELYEQQPPEPDKGDQGDQGDQGQGQGQGDAEQAQDDQGDQGDAGQAQGQGQGQTDGTGSFKGDIVQVEEPDDFKELSDEEKEAKIAEHDNQVRADNVAHKIAGTMPGALKEYFDLSAAPLKNWRAVLADFCFSRSNVEYDWQRYDRRLITDGFYLPDRGGLEIGEVIVAIDTSGSINRKQLERFLTEVNAIITECNVQETTVIHCDTKVQFVETYLEGEELIADKVHGGGGTSFRPPFDYLDEQGIEPDFLIYFTDGYCSSFADEPDYPVLWVLFDQNGYFSPPYGETTTMDEVK